MDPIPTEDIPSRRVRLAARRLVGPQLARPAFARLRARLERRDLATVTRRICAIAREHDLPPLLPLVVGLLETGLRNVDVPGNPGRGWFQMRIHALPYATSERPPTLAEAHDLDYATREFCRAAVHYADFEPRFRRDLWSWAVKTQGVGDALHRNRPYDARNFPTYLYEAAGLLAAYDDQPT